jgi:acyl-CoA synthetase (AMP-forming)/AMP-acid ligase II
VGAIFIPDAPTSELNADRLSFFGAKHVLSSSEPAAIDGVQWITIDRMWHLRLRTLRFKPLPARRRTKDDLICILLSSGTTGSAKKVMLRRSTIDLRLGHMLEAFWDEQGLGLLNLVPAQSFTGFFSTLTVWARGRAVGIRLEGESYAAILATGWFDSMLAAPVHLSQILADLPADATPMNSLRVTTGGSSLGDKLASAVRERLSPDLRMGYGTTEAGVLTRAPLITPDHREGYAGVVLPWIELEIVDEEGMPVPVGTSGEVRVRSVDMVGEYLEQPDATKRYFRDGWYHPGDVGYLDTERGLTIEGRVDELINLGGRKVLPQTVEQRARAVCDDRAVAAFAIAATGSVAQLGIAIEGREPVDEAAIAGTIPEFPAPVIIRLDVLPRNAMGKVERHILAELIDRHPAAHL